MADSKYRSRTARQAVAADAANFFYKSEDAKSAETVLSLKTLARAEDGSRDMLEVVQSSFKEHTIPQTVQAAARLYVPPAGDDAAKPANDYKRMYKACLREAERASLRGSSPDSGSGCPAAGSPVHKFYLDTVGSGLGALDTFFLPRIMCVRLPARGDAQRRSRGRAQARSRVRQDAEAQEVGVQVAERGASVECGDAGAEVGVAVGHELRCVHAAHASRRLGAHAQVLRLAV